MKKYFFLSLVICFSQMLFAKGTVRSFKEGRYTYSEKGYKCRMMMGTEVESPVDSYGFEGSKMCHYGNACNDGIECVDIPKDLDISEDGRILKYKGQTFTFTPNKKK